MDYRFQVSGVPITVSVLTIVAVLMSWFFSFGYVRRMSSRRGVLGGFFALYTGLVSSIFLMISVALHECGHALMAIMLGIPIAGSGMSWWGAYVNFPLSPTTLSPESEIALAAAGPAVNLLIALVALIQAYGKRAEESAGKYVRMYLASQNAMLGISNLLPIYMFQIGALDGGYVAHGYFRIHDHSAAQVNLDMVFATVLGVVGLFLLVVVTMLINLSISTSSSE